MSKTVAILHPGEMGAAMGAGLRARGHRVLWASAGRAPASAARASANGFEDAQTIERCVQEAEVILSVCPPHAALEVAQAVVACAYRGIYVDANAISAQTTRAIGTALEAAGASYVDAGIIGPPPVPGASVRLYLCGERAQDVAALFEGCIMQAIAMHGPIGAASALKVCYAGWNKGATALLASVRALAEAEGVDADLLAEWKISMPEIPRRSEVATSAARKAWRWIAEMEEIAANFDAAGLPPGFHLAAADIYRRLDDFKDRPAPSMGEVKSAVLARKT